MRNGSTLHAVFVWHCRGTTRLVLFIKSTRSPRKTLKVSFSVHFYGLR